MITLYTLYICIILLAIAGIGLLALVRMIDRRLSYLIDDAKLSCRVMCRSYDNRLTTLETYSGTIMAAQCCKSIFDDDNIDDDEGQLCL
jgi:hypothetical protein